VTASSPAQSEADGVAVTLIQRFGCAADLNIHLPRAHEIHSAIPCWRRATAARR
jgi:hypothetical protein